MDDNRDRDKNYLIIPEGKSRKYQTSKDVIKSSYIAEGLTPEEMSDRFLLPMSYINELIKDENLPELRKAYMVQGLDKIKNIQLNQANKLLDLDNNFKKLRILQLENILQDTVTYYERHGDFYKRHPLSGEILRNTDGIPMHIKIPNVSKELSQLKEAVTVSQGLDHLIAQIDSIIHSGKPQETVTDPDTIDVDFSDIFSPNNSDDN